MNKVYLFIHEDEDENEGYLIFSCIEAATELATGMELEPFTAHLVPLPIDDPQADIDHKYDWDGLAWNYVRA